MSCEDALSVVELASLDLLIAVAQKRERALEDVVQNTEEQAEAVAEIHMAMWEARHGGLLVSENDREILRQIGELAANLEIAPTLGELIELRAQAVRASLRAT